MARIFLIGMPGSGKTTWGRKLAEQFKFPFFDLDKEIIADSGISIAEIFETKGEDYFRQLESKRLREVVLQNEHFILATGGGTPCFLDNLVFMQNCGKVIYLQATIASLVKRLKNDSERPLLRGSSDLESTLEKLMKKRSAVYEQADLTVETYNALVEAVKMN